MTEPDQEPVGARGEDSHRTKGLLRLTMACNERCPFCNVPQEDYAELTPSEAATFAELDGFLASGARTLTISGGEPTLLRKRLVKVVREARSRGIDFVEIQTNAVLITPAYAAELAEAGVTSAFVSLLSHIPEHHDALAGLPGAYPKCLAGIDAMLDVGIRVTLNPVTALRTQALVPDFVDFVAARLPRVTFVSMSAVQPHGRGRAHAEELLPDYAVLRTSIAEARRRASVHGIELVNPYCGLPLCVGWQDDLQHSVEACEAEGGGWRRTPGIDNVGNKSQGAPCASCALRTRCGGAWHDYWALRGGSGIEAPVRLVEPWRGRGALDAVVEAPGGITPEVIAALDAATAPTVWLWTDRLVEGDAGRLVHSRCTDLALELDSLDPDVLRTPLAVVRRLVASGRTTLPQTRLRVWVALRPAAASNPTAVARVLSTCGRLGVDAVRILSDAPRWHTVAEALRREHPQLDVEAIAPRERAQGAA